MKRREIKSAKILQDESNRPKKRAETADNIKKRHNASCEYSKNINEYVHLLKDPRANEQGLDWLMKLRQQTIQNLKIPK